MSDKKADHSKIAGLVQQMVKLLQDIEADDRNRVIHAAQVVLGDPPSGGGAGGGGGGSGGPGGAGGGDHDMATFFNRDGKQKASDNAYLAAAYHYSKYGIAAFALQDLRDIASEAGVVLPDRLDMTLKQAGKKGKKLFATAGKDMYKPTATAGLFFKEQYSVSPGRQAKPEAKKE